MMGLSQEALAKAVGITFQQVQKYEKGANAMNAARLFQFAQFLHVPVAYFFDELETRGAAVTGFSENVIEFHGKEKAAPSDRESLEIMKAFKRIPQQIIRKRLADFIRAVADCKTILN